MNTIAVIGAGQLGSRHLQSLANLQGDISIQVCDPSDAALKTAAQRFEEVAEDFKGKISYHTSFSDLAAVIDVCIVATSSKVRLEVMKSIATHAKVKFMVLEKFLFTKQEEYSEAESLLNKNAIKAWVNCPRRMMHGYKDLKAGIKGPIHMVVTGNNWGLGCNGIHFLDLFSYLTEGKEMNLNKDLLDKQIIESKRAGYIEFTGTIQGVSHGNSVQITSFANDSSPVQVQIYTPTARYSIEEGAKGKLWISKLENKWAWEEKEFNMPFQSQMTHKIVEDLLKNGDCELSTYSSSANLHQQYLNCLISFMRELKNDNSINECLIT